jgi:hypothetical protein
MGPHLIAGSRQEQAVARMMNRVARGARLVIGKVRVSNGGCRWSKPSPLEMSSPGQTCRVLPTPSCEGRQGWPPISSPHPPAGDPWGVPEGKGAATFSLRQTYMPGATGSGKHTTRPMVGVATLPCAFISKEVKDQIGCWRSGDLPLGGICPRAEGEPNGSC